MLRDSLRQTALEQLDTQNLALQWATGVGKSRVAIEYCRNLINNNKTKILLIVAEIAHKDNWTKEFVKWGVKVSYVTMECYASLKKYRNSSWDLIIFDEMHHLETEIRLEIIKTLHSNKVIALSATISNVVLQELTNIFGKFYISKASLNDAIENNWLPTPKIFLIPMKLDLINKSEIIIEEWGRKNATKNIIHCDYSQRWEYLRRKKVMPNVSLYIHCTQYEKYCYLSENFEYWKSQYFQKRQEYLKTKWLRYGSLRKRYLGELKTDKVKGLLNTLKDKRYICFCTSIEQAEFLGKERAIHSEKKETAEIINDFNNKKINSLFAVGMLQEGQNLPDIEAGIIVQLDGKERPFIQKFGRTLRAETPEQYIFYYENTRDEEYLQKILEGIDPKYTTKLNL